MARPRKEEDEKRERVHASIRPGLKGRYVKMAARYGMDLSTLVDAAMKRAADVYEKDPQEILKDLLPDVQAEP